MFGIAIVAAVICAGLAYAIAKNQAPSQATLAAVLGLLLGPLGVLIAVFLREPEAKPAPEYDTPQKDVTPGDFEKLDPEDAKRRLNSLSDALKRKESSKTK